MHGCERARGATRSSSLPIAVFGLFFIYPFIYAVYISFFHWGILGKQSGAGWSNYHAVLSDPVFHTALKNIAEYTLGVVPLEMALGLSLALIVNQKIRGQPFFRSAFYFPSLASSVAITTIALYLFSSDGLFNRIIGSSTPWFTTASTAIWALVGLNAWTTSGTVMLFYLAALQSISNDVYEAAALDNTGDVADVLEDHLPFAQARPLLRARRLRRRCPQAVRPGIHRLGRRGRPELFDDDSRSLHLPAGVP